MPNHTGGKQQPKRSLSGLEVKPVYTPDDLAGTDFARDLGQPGEFPFTRGPYPNMYLGRLWTRRQIAGFGTAQATNEDRKSTRLNSSHVVISYAVFCLKKKTQHTIHHLLSLCYLQLTHVCFL